MRNHLQSIVVIARRLEKYRGRPMKSVQHSIRTTWPALFALAALLAMATVACAAEEEAEPAAPAPAATTAPAPAAAPAAPTAAPAPAAPAQPAASMEQTGTLNVAMIKIGAPTGLPGMQTGGGPEQMPERLSLMQRLIEREPISATRLC